MLTKSSPVICTSVIPGDRSEKASGVWLTLDGLVSHIVVDRLLR